jgi:hypothetical protein
MKKIRFALLPAFLVAIVGAFAAQGSSEPNLAQYYKRVGGTGGCQTTTCSPTNNGAICTSVDKYYSTKTAAGDCTNPVSGNLFLP